MSWYQPNIHPALDILRLMPSFASSVPVVEVQVKGNVRHPSLLDLWENKLFNRAILAPTSLLELCTAAGRMLLGNGDSDGFEGGSPMKAILHPAIFMSEFVVLTFPLRVGTVSVHIAGPGACSIDDVTFLRAHWHIKPLHTHCPGFTGAKQKPPHLDSYSLLAKRTLAALCWLRVSCICYPRSELGTVTLLRHLVTGNLIHPTLSEAAVQLLLGCKQLPGMLCACGIYLPSQNVSVGTLNIIVLQLDRNRTMVHLEKETQHLLHVSDILEKLLTTLSNESLSKADTPNLLATFPMSSIQCVWRRMPIHHTYAQ